MGWNEAQNCAVPFIDCRGYYDLAAQIVGCMATAVLLVWTINNYRGLRREKGSEDVTEYQRSLRRKIRINLMNIIFLTFFIMHIFFSMVLFQVGNEGGAEALTSNKLNLLYKFTEVVFVLLLNAMLLTVGWLYWKGLNAFFIIKQMHAPCLYRNGIIYCFGASYFYLIAVAITSGVFLLFSQTVNSEPNVINILVLVSCLISIAFFLTFRLLYYKNIFMSVKLGGHTIRREQFYNLLILSTSFARIVISVLSILEVSLDATRSYEYGQCHDTLPLHGIILLLITFLVDLLPSFIFTRIFTTFERHRGTHSDIEKTLFSAQPSDLSSGMEI